MQHVSKLRKEGLCTHSPYSLLLKKETPGSFCGYRNIQMLISYIIASGSTGSELFGKTFPTIFEIQDLIENAWDNGYNSQGRVETGGIRGTRKYIGTPEVCLLRHISSGHHSPLSRRRRYSPAYRYRKYQATPLWVWDKPAYTDKLLGVPFKLSRIKMVHGQEHCCSRPLSHTFGEVPEMTHPK